MRERGPVRRVPVTQLELQRGPGGVTVDAGPDVPVPVMRTAEGHDLGGPGVTMRLEVVGEVTLVSAALSSRCTRSLGLC